MSVGCITKTWNWKPSHLNIIISLLQGGEKEREQERDSLLLESAYSLVLWLQRYHSPGVHGQRCTKINSMTYMKILKKAERTNHSHSFGEKSQFFFNILSDPTIMLPLQGWQDSIRFNVVSHPPYSLDLAPSEFWLFAALKKHVKGIQFTCNEEVQAAMVKWLQGQPKDFYTDCSEKLVHHWQHCIKLEAHCTEKWAIEIKCIFCVTYCVVSFRCFVWT